MSKSFQFKSRHGKTYEIRFVKTRYTYDGSLAVQVECFDSGFNCFMPYGNLTVNLDCGNLGCSAFLDSNNSPDLCDFVIANGWAKEYGQKRSGFCTYPLVIFSDKFLNDVCEEAA